MVISPERRPLWPLLASFAAFGVFWGSWAALIPAMRERTDATVSELGTAVLAVAFGALPALLTTGLAVDRWGSRVLPATLAAFGLAVLLPAFASSPAWLAASLLLVGVASGALDVAANAGVSEWETATGRHAMSAAHAVYSAGVVVSAVAVGFARDAGVGAPAVLAVAAGTLLGAAAVNARGHVSPPRPADRRAPRLDFSRRVLVFGALCALGFVVEGGIELWSALYVEETLGGSPAAGGLAPGLFAAAMVAGRLVNQALATRVADAVVLAGGGITAAAGVALAASTDSVAVALAGFALGGAGVSVVAPVTFGAAGRAAEPARRGAAVGSVTAFGYVGFLIGPPLVGGVAGGASLRVGLVVLVGIALVLAAASGALRARTVRRAGS